MQDVMLRVEMTPVQGDIDRLGQGLSEHALAFTGGPGFRPLAVFARQRDEQGDGPLVGGVAAHVNWNWLQISLVWVAAELRHTGLGTRLLDAIEDEGKRLGCTRAHLDTFSFQARPFYERRGYVLYATLDDYPPGHQRFYLRKEL